MQETQFHNVSLHCIIHYIVISCLWELMRKTRLAGLDEQQQVLAIVISLPVSTPSK